jgi:hypothetical protein
MKTIQQFAGITNNLSNTAAVLQDLAYQYKEIAARTDLDVAHIDLLVAQAEQMIIEANALKTIAYDPTTDSKDPVVG